MATPSSIAAFLSTAQAQGLTMQQIYVALQYAIVSGLSDDGRTVNVQTSDGTTLAVLPFDAAMNAMRNVRRMVAEDAGGVFNAAEFAPFGSGNNMASN